MLFWVRDYSSIMFKLDLKPCVTAKKFQCMLQMCQVLNPFPCKNREEGRMALYKRKLVRAYILTVRSLHCSSQMDKLVCLGQNGLLTTQLQKEWFYPTSLVSLSPKEWEKDQALSRVMDIFSQVMSFDLSSKRNAKAFCTLG